MDPLLDLKLDPASWNVDDVICWIACLDLTESMIQRAQAAIIENDVDGEVLLNEFEDLESMKKLRIHSFGLRCKLWQAIQFVKKHGIVDDGCEVNFDNNDENKDAPMSTEPTRIEMQREHQLGQTIQPMRTVTDWHIFNVSKTADTSDDLQPFCMVGGRRRGIKMPFQRVIQRKIRRMLSRPCLLFSDEISDYNPPQKNTIGVWISPVAPTMRAARIPVRVYVKNGNDVKDFWDNTGSYLPSAMSTAISTVPSTFGRVDEDDTLLPAYGDSDDDLEMASEEEEEHLFNPESDNAATTGQTAEDRLREIIQRLPAKVSAEVRKRKRPDSDFDDRQDSIENRTAETNMRTEETELDDLTVDESPTTVDDISRAIQEEIRRKIVRWRETVLPKLQRKAIIVYKKRKSKRAWVKTLADIRERRLPKLINGIKVSAGSSIIMARRACQSLNQTIEEAEELEWMISVCNGPEPEPYVPKLSRNSRQRQPNTESNAEDEEIGESNKGSDDESSDEHWSDFIASEDDDPRGKIRYNPATDEIVDGSESDDPSPDQKSRAGRKRHNQSSSSHSGPKARKQDRVMPEIEDNRERGEISESEEVVSGQHFQSVSGRIGGQSEVIRQPYARERSESDPQSDFSRSEEIVEVYDKNLTQEGVAEAVDNDIVIVLDSDDEDEISQPTPPVEPKLRRKRVLSNSFVDEESGEEFQPTQMRGPVMKATSGRRKRPQQSSDESEEDSDEIMLDYNDDDNDDVIITDYIPSQSFSRERNAPSSSANSRSNDKKKGRRDIREIAPESEAVVRNRASRERKERAIQDRARRQVLENSGTERILINIGHAETEEPIYIDSFLGSCLKPHQIEGVQFMWRTLLMVTIGEDEDGSPQYSGSILAHAMGLGKTIQTITVIYTLLRELKNGNKSLPAHLRHITRNNEIQKWIEPDLIDEIVGDIFVFKASKRDRYRDLEKWNRDGGILITSYQLLQRSLTSRSKNTDVSSSVDPELFKKLAREAFVDPGPALIVCDEGHTIKNPKTAITALLNSVKTPSRLCLTGYPLQNNLVEYWCMVNFVAPGYLGSSEEFRNQYDNPITNGNYEDSTETDKKISRERLHVLIKVLEPIVMRRDDAPLKLELPEKKEFIISSRLTDQQRQLYISSLNTYDMHSYENLFAKSMWFTMLCNHPGIFKTHLEKMMQREIEKKRDEAARNALVEEAMLAGEVPEDLLLVLPTLAERTRCQKLLDFMDAFDIDWKDPELCYKVQIIKAIVDASIAANDKILVFSRSLETIAYLEDLFAGHYDFLTITGSTANSGKSSRQNRIDQFNDPNSTVNVFLISTQAGSVGVNLPTANRVILVDLGWNPSFDQQAIARSYRYGQKKNVYVYRLVTFGTFEERLFNNNMSKLDLSKKVVDKKKSGKGFTKEELKNYFHIPPDNPASEVDLSADYGDNVLHAGLIKIQFGNNLLRSLEADITEAEKESMTAAYNTEIRKRRSARLEKQKTSSENIHADLAGEQPPQPQQRVNPVSRVVAELFELDRMQAVERMRVSLQQQQQPQQRQDQGVDDQQETHQSGSNPVSQASHLAEASVGDGMSRVETPSDDPMDYLFGEGLSD
ncbi:hypothetical protein HDU97_001174 [Phlyctochytrium planicorne]|nr:hypothetical protein HDU97_001174 [Phlyctochytrium planicorne]